MRTADIRACAVSRPASADALCPGPSIAAELQGPRKNARRQGQISGGFAVDVHQDLLVADERSYRYASAAQRAHDVQPEVCPFVHAWEEAEELRAAEIAHAHHIEQSVGEARLRRDVHATAEEAAIGDRRD